MSRAPKKPVRKSSTYGYGSCSDDESRTRPSSIPTASSAAFPAPFFSAAPVFVATSNASNTSGRLPAEDSSSQSTSAAYSEEYPSAIEDKKRSSAPIRKSRETLSEQSVVETSHTANASVDAGASTLYEQVISLPLLSPEARQFYLGRNDQRVANLDSFASVKNRFEEFYKQEYLSAPRQPAGVLGYLNRLLVDPLQVRANRFLSFSKYFARNMQKYSALVNKMERDYQLTSQPTRTPAIAAEEKVVSSSRGEAKTRQVRRRPVKSKAQNFFDQDYYRQQIASISNSDLQQLAHEVINYGSDLFRIYNLDEKNDFSSRHFSIKRTLEFLKQLLVDIGKPAADVTLLREQFEQIKQDYQTNRNRFIDQQYALCKQQVTSLQTEITRKLTPSGGLEYESQLTEIRREITAVERSRNLENLLKYFALVAKLQKIMFRLPQHATSLMESNGDDSPEDHAPDEKKRRPLSQFVPGSMGETLQQVSSRTVDVMSSAIAGAQNLVQNGAALTASLSSTLTSRSGAFFRTTLSSIAPPEPPELKEQRERLQKTLTLIFNNSFWTKHTKHQWLWGGAKSKFGKRERIPTHLAQLQKSIWDNLSWSVSLRQNKNALDFNKIQFSADEIKKISSIIRGNGLAAKSHYVEKFTDRSCGLFSESFARGLFNQRSTKTQLLYDSLSQFSVEDDSIENVLMSFQESKEAKQDLRS